MRRRIEVSGPVDVASAWERYEVLENWPRWSPQIRAVDADEPRLTPGMHGIVRGPVGIAVPFRIESVDAETHSWTWRVALAGMSATLHHDLTAEGSGTRAGLTIEGPAAVALTYGPGARLALHRLCARTL